MCWKVLSLIAAILNFSREVPKLCRCGRSGVEEISEEIYLSAPTENVSELDVHLKKFELLENKAKSKHLLEVTMNY